MSNFPEQLDTDAELPRISDNITEIDSEALNAIREAIFAIEATLGADVNGSANSVKDRLDAVLNPDGTFKSAALIAAGLIALPITNSMVGASAAIEESKLDLNYSTQSLFNQISSHTIDITALQLAINNILANFLAHISGAAFKHDGYDILLDSAYPSSVPPDIAPFSAISLSEAIYAIKTSYVSHIASNKIGAHSASNISLNTTNLSQVTSNNLQGAVEQLENLGEDFLIDHRDDMHASGFSNWANSRDGYSTYLQLLPTTFGAFVPATILPDQQVIQFDGYTLSALNIKQGDVVLIPSQYSASGSYTVDDIGPRGAIGSKPALSSSQLAVIEHIQDDGYVYAAIFAPSSTSTLKCNMAPTIHQSDIRVDSIQVSRSNSAKILSLGLNPIFINSAHTLGLEVGIGSGLSRTISIGNLHYDRSAGPAPTITIDTIVERLNYVFQNRSDGYAFPVSAYRVGDELLLSHNWAGSDNYYIKITTVGSTAQALYLLGFDNYGANIIDRAVRPTHTAKYYVAGQQLTDVATILHTTANVSGQIFTFPGLENPLALGVKVGHLLHLKTHNTASNIGTYFITGVNSSSITIHKNAGITLQSGVEIEILHDVVPLDEIQSYGRQATIEIIYDLLGRGEYTLRSDNDLVTNVTTNLEIAELSDNFPDGSTTLSVISSGTGKQLAFSGGISKIIPPDFTGNVVLRDGSNSAFANIRVQSPLVGTGIVSLVVYPHSLEEEVLEVASVWFDGLTTLKYLSDRRLFGTTGLDELREDVVRAHVELPLKELRSNGIVGTGFDAITTNYTDAESIANLGSDKYGILFRGGVAVVNGARQELASAAVYFPFITAQYIVYINERGSVQYVPTGTTLSDGYFSLSEILDGYLGEVTPIARVSHSGTGSTPLTYTDLRYFINDLDSRIDFVLDTTNRRVGSFATFTAAEEYINNYPFDEKNILHIVSKDTTNNISTTSGSKQIHIDLSGQMGTLTANSDIKITSSGIKENATAKLAQLSIGSGCNTLYVSDIKISGNATTPIAITSTGQILYFENVEFAGAVNFDTDALLVFNNCVFADTSTLTLEGTRIKLLNCRILSTSISITNENTVEIIGCYIEPDSASFGSYLASSSNFKNIIESTVFSGLSGGNTAIFHCETLISKCIFKDISFSSNALIDVPGSGGPYSVSIIQSAFQTVAMTGSALLSEGAATRNINFEHCEFNGMTFPNAMNIVATKFNNNTINSSVSGHAIVGIVGTGMAEGNLNIGAIQYESTSTSNIINSISNNVFSDPSIGYNVFCNAAATGRSLKIQGNTFASKILLNSTSRAINISHNIFNGTDGVDFGTLSSSTSSIFINNNFFNCSTQYFPFSNACGQVYIQDNLFISNATITTSTLQLNDNCSFSGNSIGSNSQSFIITGGSAVSNLRIQNNFISVLQISISLNNAVINNNAFDTSFTFGSGVTLTDSSISNNYFGSIVANACTMDRSIFNDNIGSINITGSANITWKDSVISKNIFDNGGSTVTFTCYNAASAYCNNIINENVFDSPVSLAATTSVKGLNFTNNKFINTQLSSTVILEESTISHNTGVNIQFTAGLDASSVTFNDTIVSAVTSTISGTMTNSNISDNNMYGALIKPTAGSQYVKITRNTVQDDLTIFDTDNASYSLTDSIIDSNIIAGDLIFGSNTGSSASRTLQNTSIFGNRVDNLLFLTAVAAAGATYLISSVQFMHNNILGNMTFWATTGTFDNYFNIKIFANNIEETLAIHGGAVTHTADFQVAYNQIEDLIIGTSGTANTYNHITIGNNVIGNNMTLSGTLTDSHIVHNNISADTDLTDLTGIIRLNLSHNICGSTLQLPAISVFGTADEQSKFIGNYAGTWSAPSAFATAGTTNVFPWGNTSNGVSATVTFSGTTATNTGTANNTIGAGILC